MRLEDTILILGASNNPARTSYMATRFLFNKGFNLFAVANRKGHIDEVPLHDDSELSNNLKAETITLFLNPERQKKYYNYILSLKPKRIIFNPGTENPELALLATEHHIQVISGCTIALLTTGVL